MDIFLHVPKTGGTTLGFPLRWVYGWQNTLSVGHDDGNPPQCYVSRTEKQKRQIHLVKGHHLFGLHEHAPGSCTYFTFLREPVSRLASMHRMLKKEWPDYAIGDRTLREFVLSDHPASQTNSQTAYIAGVEPAKVMSGSRDVLERAKDHLDEYFDGVGLTERYDESLILLKRRLGWERYPYYVTSRVGAQSENEKKERTLKEETRSFIETENALDVELYQYAQDRFKSDIEKEGKALKKEVMEFKERNAKISPILKTPLWMYRRIRRTIYITKRKLI